MNKSTFENMADAICKNHNEKPTCEYGCCAMCFSCGNGHGQSPHNKEKAEAKQA